MKKELGANQTNKCLAGPEAKYQIISSKYCKNPQLSQLDNLVKSFSTYYFTKRIKFENVEHSFWRNCPQMKCPWTIEKILSKKKNVISELSIFYNQQKTKEQTDGGNNFKLVRTVTKFQQNT